MRLLTRKEIQEMYRHYQQEHNGATAQELIYPRRDVPIEMFTREVVDKANKHARRLFPSGGYEAITAYNDYINYVLHDWE